MVLVVSSLVSGSQAMSLSSEIIVDALAFTIRIDLETICKIGSKQRPLRPSEKHCLATTIPTILFNLCAIITELLLNQT